MAPRQQSKKELVTRKKNEASGKRTTTRVRNLNRMMKNQIQNNLNWNKLADFRGRQTAKDIETLLESRSELAGGGPTQSDRPQMLINKPDATGLYPIHWASIHNRPDLIELMVDKYKSPLRLRCSNELFANCSSLHFASMNGSLEAAAKLLELDNKKLTRRRNNNSQADQEGNTSRQVEDGIEKQSITNSNDNDENSWLEDRDSQGQTALMRAAPARSKKLNVIRDLLGKNLWSLSGRPAEMALFLMAHGADWTVTEPHQHMGLIHLAIINDYEDIVHMLINIDPSLVNQRLSIADNSRSTIVNQNNENDNKNYNDNKSPSSEASKFNFKTLNELPSPGESVRRMATPSPAPSSSSDNSMVNLFDRSQIVTISSDDSSIGSKQKLIKPNTKTRELVAAGLRPIDLAIVYGRIRMINMLRPEGQFKVTSQATLLKATCMNRHELQRFVKSMGLRIAFALDLSFLILIWSPIYLFGGQGTFYSLGGLVVILTSLLTILAALRVVIREPGYLPLEESEYFRRLDRILSKNPRYQTEKMKKSRILEPGGSDEEATTTHNNNRNIKNIENVDWLCRKLCHKCNCIRTPRSRHCNYCNRCIQEFDHHCLYLSSCIGLHNRVEFLLMLIGLALTGIYSLIYQNLIDQNNRPNWVVHQFSQLLGLVNFLSGFLGAFCVLKRAAQGVTLYESIRSNRIRRIFGSRGPSNEISKSHDSFSTRADSFWRYSPDRFLTGDLPQSKVKRNLREFANGITWSAGSILIRLLGSDFDSLPKLSMASENMRRKLNNGAANDRNRLNNMV